MYTEHTLVFTGYMKGLIHLSFFHCHDSYWKRHHIHVIMDSSFNLVDPVFLFYVFNRYVPDVKQPYFT